MPDYSSPAAWPTKRPTPGVAVVGHWTDQTFVSSALAGGVRGTVPDPQASPVAAARVFEGGAIRRSRAELADLLAPMPMPGRMQVADHIDEAIDTRDLAYELAVRAGGRDRADRQELEAVLSHIARHGDGAELLAPELAELAVLLSNSTVRDAVMALATGALHRVIGAAASVVRRTLGVIVDALRGVAGLAGCTFGRITGLAAGTLRGTAQIVGSLFDR